MEFVNKFIDVDDHLRSKQQPTYLMDLAGGVEYHTPISSLVNDNIQWSITRTGDKVRVPIFAYRTKEKFNISIWGLGLQCGMIALSAYGRLGWPDKEPESVVLVFGDKCHEFEDGYRVYLGLTMVRNKNG